MNKKIFDFLRTILAPFTPTAQSFQEGYRTGLYGLLSYDDLNITEDEYLTKIKNNHPKMRAFRKGFEKATEFMHDNITFRNSMLKIFGFDINIKK